MRSAIMTSGLAVIALAGCGWHGLPGGPDDPQRASGPLRTQTYAVHGFHGIEVGAACEGVVQRTGAESLEVTAEEDVLPFVQAEVRAGRLVLGLRPGHAVGPTRAVVFRVGARDLDLVEASGASRLEVGGVATDRFLVRLSGASAATVAGTAASVEAYLSGASRLRAENLEALTVIGGFSGASYARLRVRDHLEVQASGASVVEYLGSPRVVAQVSGASVVHRLGGE